MADDVEVTQADREAAADLVPENARSGVLAGFSDKQPLLQTLARHRIASVRVAALPDDADLYDAPSDDLMERVADAIEARMGPLAGSPEYLADPDKLARSQRRRRDGAVCYARAAIAAVGQDTRSQVEREIVAWMREVAATYDRIDDGLSGLDKMSQGITEAADAIEHGQYRSEG